MADAPDTSLLDRAREALGRHEWRLAFDELSAADAERSLTSEELELLAEAAWWIGRLPTAIDARERAYALATRAGDTVGAVTAAIGLARDNLFRLSASASAGWIRRAEQLLEGVEENPAHGWLAGVQAFRAALMGDTDGSLEAATRAHDIGVRFKDRDLEIFGLGEQAAALVSQGRVQEGLALADEATVAAVSGELEPAIAGAVCCSVIEACTGIGDLKRASEWTEAQDRWSRREGINGYPGMCRLFRSEIKRLRGAWPEAEAEARLASDELRGFMPAGASLALYQIGEIRLRRGDLPAAEEALLRAHAEGQDPEPALSLLRLAQGRVEVAADSIRRAIADPLTAPSWKAPANSDLGRLAFLPAQVEIALAAGDVPTARAAADELASLAERFQTPSARGAAATAQGAVALAEGDAGAAVRHLREAVTHWTELDAPYELARARLTLADAYAAQDAREPALIELRAARAGFERLGAALDLRRADGALAALGGGADSAPVGKATTRVVRTFMFTDIVDSTRLAETLGDEAWDKVLRWHDQALRTAVAEQGGEEVKATGDGFFLAFADPDAAIEAAIAIQRRLAAQRETQSFAPAVRIGIHVAEANRIGLDYAGSGVNLASRIGAAAKGGEILASAATVAGARHTFALGRGRTLKLKGVSTPTAVRSIDWR